MNASLLQSDSLAGQVRSLLAAVDRLQAEVGELRRENAELRRENAELRQQVSELRCEVGYWKSRHADAVQRNIQLQAELEQAKAEIRQLKAERFGKQSEKQSATDRSNQLDDPQEKATPQEETRTTTGPPRSEAQRLLALTGPRGTGRLARGCESLCVVVASHWRTSDRVTPASRSKLKRSSIAESIRRKRYRQTCDCRPQPRTVTAPLPPKLLPKSLYGTSIWVHLLLEKFHLQRPTHRTIEQLRLLGLDLAAGTIADGLQRIEPLMTPIYEAIRAYHLLSDYFHADETRWRVFVEKAGKTGHLWWLWLFAGQDSVVYVLDPSRSHDVPQSHFPDDVQGVLMVDRYSAYKAMRQVKDGKLLLAFCWAHVRARLCASRQRLPGTPCLGSAVAASNPRVVSPESGTLATRDRYGRVRHRRCHFASARRRDGCSARCRTGGRQASRALPQSAGEPDTNTGAA